MRREKASQHTLRKARNKKEGDEREKRKPRRILKARRPKRDEGDATMEEETQWSREATQDEEPTCEAPTKKTPPNTRGKGPQKSDNKRESSESKPTAKKQPIKELRPQSPTMAAACTRSRTKGRKQK